MAARALGLPLCGLVLIACGASEGPLVLDAGPTELDAGADDAGPGTVDRGLPAVHEVDPVRAARGRSQLVSGRFGGRLIPGLAIRNLWVVWDGRPRDDAAYWRDFSARYGAVADPEAPDGPPLGLKIGGDATLDCLFCHSGRVAGRTLIGAPSRVDLERLYDDLVRLNERGPDFGFPRFPIPFELDGFTGAPGAHDAFGLGLRLAAATHPAATPPEDCGFQRPAPWWTARYKTARYADGSASQGGHRLMMATLLAFGLTFAEIQALDATFEDVDAAILAVESPAWPFETPAEPSVAAGRAVFETACAGCHGTYDGPDRGFPGRVVPRAEVGTDPLRAACFTAETAAWINASWFGAEAPMTPTDGYLAPALTGVWAAAPYFHNGSVPTLGAVLDPSLRPPAWRRTGVEADDYDPVQVGLRFETSGPGLYDTARPGLAATGHRYGADLSPAARAALLDYLKTL